MRTSAMGSRLQKLVQVETTYGYLVSYLDTKPERIFLFLTSAAPLRLHCVDRCTGEALRETLRRSSSASLGLSEFEQRARLPRFDNAPQNPYGQRTASLQIVAAAVGECP